MNPLIYVGAILLTFALIFIVSFICIKDKKEAFGFDRNMKDSEIVKRLLKYAKPYTKNFVLVFSVMAFSVASSIILPLIIGDITQTLQQEGGFKYQEILNSVILYIGLLLLIFDNFNKKNYTFIT